MMGSKIERISWPSVDVFKREYIEPGKPVILSRGLGNCTAASWTPDYLCSVVGQKRLRVAVSSDDVFGYTTDGEQYKEQVMEFSAAVSVMRHPSATKYYIMQIPIHQDLPELENDICRPPVIDAGDLQQLNFWLSASGDVTPLHYDSSNNLLAQIHGKKEVTLFSPDQYEHLYPLPLGTRHPHVSQLNFMCPDLAKFPLFEKAVGEKFIIEAGDVLFLPAFWWHGVKSLTMSISLNFWWKIDPSQFLVPIMLERLVEMFDRTRLKEIGVGGHGLIDAAAYALHRKNLAWAASLLAAAGLDQQLRKLLNESNVSSDDIPSRLDALNAEVRKVAEGSAVDSKKIESWMRIEKAARSANDSSLVRAGVADMVEGISQFIVKSSS